MRTILAHKFVQSQSLYFNRLKVAAVRPSGTSNESSGYPVIALDEQLDGRVQRALQRHPSLTNGKLQCETNDGRVTLRGVVSTYYQKQIAQELLRGVEGVREVVNHLEVNWKKPRRRTAVGA